MARDLVAAIACGWPYVATLICHHAGLHAIDAARSTVLPGDVVSALDEAIDELRMRMSKTVQVQVDRLMAEGTGKLLTVIAGAALKASGPFTPFEIESEATKAPDADAAKKLAEQLSSENLLLERRDDVHGRRYAFLEDSLSQYLWFLGTKQNFQEPRVKTPRVSNG